MGPSILIAEVLMARKQITAAPKVEDTFTKVFVDKLAAAK